MKRLLSLVALLFATSASAISLEGSTDSLEMITGFAGSITYDVAWSNVTATALTTPGTTKGNVATATTTTIVAAPAASNWRYVRTITIYNADTVVANRITIQKDVSATNRVISTFSLAPGEYATVDDVGVVTMFSSTGVRQEQNLAGAGYNGQVYGISKAGTTKDSAGYWYMYGKDAGFPGASVMGGPNVNGWDTDCSVASNAADPAGAAQIGTHVLPDPVTGNLYLTQISIASPVVEAIQLIDVLWYNNVAVAIGAQAIAMGGGLGPPRDVNGSTNGEGVQAALYAQTALGLVAQNFATTITYTDSAGNAGNTGTFQNVIGFMAPASPVVGTFVPFSLAAGDRGVRAITSYEAATTYVSGTPALVLYRPLITIPVAIGYAPVVINIPPPGIRIYPNSCLVTISGGSLTASTHVGSYTIIER